MIPETKARIRATVKLWTVIVSIVFCTVVFQLWVIAFYNGDSVVVYINLFGERAAELVLWIIAFPVLTYGLVSLLKQQLRECRMARRKWNRKFGKVERL
jgi:hypothetical protein